MRGSALIGPILLLLGAVAIGIAVASGGAHAALIVIIPVFYGSSLLFLAGVALVIAGFLTLPLTLAAEEPEGAPAGPPSGVSSGGLVLIGPIPIFWGSASGASRGVRVAAAAAGAIALVVAVVVFLIVFH
jgi:uncharacterized membrane protein